MAAEVERKKQADELESLQLEETRHRVRQLRGEQNMRQIRSKAIENSLRSTEARDKARQAGCWHKKGGKGTESTYRGNDANYAVVKHQLPHGPIVVICQRCDKEWKAPDPALNARGASVEDRKRYARELKEYQEALNFPTDNTMSGSQMFVVTRDPIQEALAV